MHKAGGGKPAKMLGRQHFAIAPVVLAKDDRRVDLSAVESIEQLAGVVEPHFDGERRVMGIEPCQQGRDFRPTNMGGNPQRKATASRREPGDRAIMCGEEVTSGLEERCTLG